MEALPSPIPSHPPAASSSNGDGRTAKPFPLVFNAPGAGEQNLPRMVVLPNVFWKNFEVIRSFNCFAPVQGYNKGSEGGVDRNWTGKLGCGLFDKRVSGKIGESGLIFETG